MAIVGSVNFTSSLNPSDASGASDAGSGVSAAELPLKRACVARARRERFVVVVARLGTLRVRAFRGKPRTRVLVPVVRGGLGRDDRDRARAQAATGRAGRRDDGERAGRRAAPGGRGGG